tara:strand:- start:310 stop:786 length:477 start_codon:yes stop_codon:yes gene_type:complete
MHNLSDKDKKIWNFYTSNLNFIKKTEKKREFHSRTFPEISRVLRSNISFALDPKTKKNINSKKFVIDAIVDLHGKTEIQAYEVIKNFIKNSYLEELKNIIIITGKGANSQGKLKLKTPSWLKNEELSKFIVGFETMPYNKGGEGALFVKLKNKNKYNM